MKLHDLIVRSLALAALLAFAGCANDEEPVTTSTTTTESTSVHPVQPVQSTTTETHAVRSY